MMRRATCWVSGAWVLSCASANGYHTLSKKKSKSFRNMSCRIVLKNHLMNFGSSHLTISQHYLSHLVHRLCLCLFRRVKSFGHAELVVRVTDVYEVGSALPVEHPLCNLIWSFTSFACCSRAYSDVDLPMNYGLFHREDASLAHAGLVSDLNYFEFLCLVIFRTWPTILLSKTICEQSVPWMAQI